MTRRKPHRYPYLKHNSVRQGIKVVNGLQGGQSQSATDRGEQSGGSDGGQDIARFVKRGRDVIVESRNALSRSANLLAAAIEGVQGDRPGVQSLLILPESEDVQRVASLSADALRKGARSRVRIVHLGPADDARTETKAVSNAPDVVVTTSGRLIDHIRRDNIDLSLVAVCVLCPPSGGSAEHVNGQFGADLHFIYTKFRRQPTTILFRDAGTNEMGGVEDLIRRPAIVALNEAASAMSNPSNKPTQEQTTMANDLPFDAESTAQQLRDIVRRIHEDEDPAVMNQYKKFIKKHVSIFARAYFTAYLFKHFSGGAASPRPAGSSRAAGSSRGARPSRGAASAAGTSPDSTRTSVPTSDQASVFVSAGRNRRVHARDLVTLFTSADGVSREDIGQIKVLDNYSFVEVSPSKAQLAIDALDGSDFRGRKLTVNFAKKK